MSANDRPEQQAYRELETLVRSLGDELATFRRRALAAENQLRDGGPSASSKPRSVSPERFGDLEAENATLRTRLSSAEERVRQMMDRVRFLRQQLQIQPTVSAKRP